MRAGTTWLYDTLKGAPNIWSPPVKETRILLAMQELGPTTCAQRFGAAGGAHGAAQDQVDWWRTVTWEPYLGAMSTQVSSWLQSGFGPDGALELEFWLRYLGEPLTLDLYDSLANLAASRHMLDVSPDYMGLTAGSIQNFTERFPRAKFIVMLRSPADRLLSQARMDVACNALDARPTQLYINEFLGSRFSKSQINVHHHLDKIIRFVDPHNIFIVFFEDIANNMSSLCEKLSKFCDSFIKPTINVPVNSFSQLDNVSDEVLRHIEQVTAPVLEPLAALVGGHAVHWFKRERHMEQYLHSDTYANLAR